MRTGSTIEPASPGTRFRAADHLRDDAEIALYLEEMLADDDSQAACVALRTIAEALGGVSALAERAGVDREVLDRTFSDNVSPCRETLTAIRAAFRA
jgi:probable addiction module antidote protein